MTDEIKPTTQDAFQRNMQLMNTIIATMKEIPELPSEAPKDVSPLEKVEFPDEGVLTYMSHQDGTMEVKGKIVDAYKSHDYPYKGFPFYEFVDKIDLIKKISRAVLSGFYHRFKARNKFQLIFLIPAIWFFKDLVYVGIYTFHRMIDRFKIKPIRYCIAVRELYRTLDYAPFNEDKKTKDLRLMLKDLLCMILEFDNAYRYRFQDVISEINLDAVKKNMIKEVNRLLDILSEREQTQDIKDTWTLLKLFFTYYLKIDKRVYSIIQNALFQLNIEKVKLDEGDKYYCTPRKDYKFGFMFLKK